MGAVHSWCRSVPEASRIEIFVKGTGSEESTFPASDLPHRALYQTTALCLNDEAVYGNGTFGVVSRSCEKSMHDELVSRTVAVKRSSRVKEHESLQNERAILATIDHPHIVKLYGFVPTDAGPVWQMMEDCPGGELYSLIATKGALPDATAATYFRQVLTALNHLHTVMKIVHRDLKPENILMTQDRRRVKLCDFGTAAILAPVRGSKASGRIGSLSYAAPEVYSSSQADFSSDMWSAGVLLYVMCCASSPFRCSEDKDPEKETVERVKRGEINKNRDKWKQISVGPKKLILSLLQLDSSRRLTAGQALSNSWLKQGRRISGSVQPETLEALKKFAAIEDDQVLRAWRAIGSQLNECEEASDAFELLDKDLDGIIGFNDLSLTDYPVDTLRTCYTYSEVVAALIFVLPLEKKDTKVRATLPFAYEAFGGLDTGIEFAKYKEIIICPPPIN